jgi:hypothetical protein
MNVMLKTIAIVGASTDRRKYGNKAVRAFVHGGWTVYPVNEKADEIEGLQCYRSLTEIPGRIDRIALYVPPHVGKTLLPQIAQLRPAEFFLNPGSEDAELIERAVELGLRPIQACSVVNIGLRPEMFSDD